MLADSDAVTLGAVVQHVQVLESRELIESRKTGGVQTYSTFRDTVAAYGIPAST